MTPDRRVFIWGTIGIFLCILAVGAYHVQQGMAQDVKPKVPIDKAFPIRVNASAAMSGYLRNGKPLLSHDPSTPPRSGPLSTNM